MRLKKKDPVLKQPDVVLFPQQPDEEGSEGDDGTAAAAGTDGSKKSKPMYLRTVLAKQVRQRVQAVGAVSGQAACARQCQRSWSSRQHLHAPAASKASLHQ